MKKIIFLFCLVFLYKLSEGQTFNMCTGTTSSSATSGIVYDSGGPSGAYNNNQNCTFLIRSACNGTIYLNISGFSTESGYDYLTVFNGSTTSSPVLGNYSGTAFPPTLIANSGFMLLRFTSDGSATYNGFTASWNSVAGNCAPVANFNTSINSCQGSVFFTNTSLNNPTTYDWDFGDGNISSLPNPTNIYTNAGTYTVELTVSNLFGTNSIKKNVTVNPLNFSMGYLNSSLLMYAPITFTTDFNGAQSYLWNFGNGNSASTKFVQHTYMALGTYSVTLNVTNFSCSTTRTLVIEIDGTLGLNEVSSKLSNAVLAPNPTNSDVTLTFDSKVNDFAEINIYNVLGMLIKKYKNVELMKGENLIKLEDLSPGLNTIQIKTSSGSLNIKALRTEN
jgi:PKD repeat protein